VGVECAVRELRLALIEAIAARLERSPLTQGELAATLGITRPRLNRLLKREVELFGLDSLAAIAARAGLVVRVTVTRPYRHR
jgi:predicted XRE-type DNA-binding protein